MGSSLPYAEAGPEGSTRVGGASSPTATTRFRPSSFARDVVPVPLVARTFTWLEAVTGQLYLAILIARLVGLQISSSQQSG